MKGSQIPYLFREKYPSRRDECLSVTIKRGSDSGGRIGANFARFCPVELVNHFYDLVYLNKEKALLTVPADTIL